MTHLYILGSGIKGSLQFTRETEQALRACRVAFILHDDIMVHEFVKQLCPDARDLVDVYSGKRTRREAYAQISEVLVEEAARAPSVAFIAHGHPLFLVSAAELTIELARQKGLTVEVLPAVSSFDTLLCDLGIDYGYGVQMFDATTMVQNGWLLSPSYPALIFQLATTLESGVVRSEPPPSILTPLVRHLEMSYPPDHPCVILHSSAHLLETSSRVDLAIAALDKHPGIELWRRPTLYVPAAR